MKYFEEMSSFSVDNIITRTINVSSLSRQLHVH